MGYEILRKSDNKKLLIEYMQSDVPNLDSPMGSDLTIPGEPPENNLLLGYLGQSKEFEWDFILLDDGTDISDGTRTTAATSLDEQRKYLIEEFVSADLSVEYEFSGPGFTTFTGSIINVSAPRRANSPREIEAKIRIKVGTVI